jgi:methylated-DNA-[protein]-cysteine S-methyltransferase
VQRHLTQIEYGHTRTNGQLAQLVDPPRAAHTVGGTACATDPLPIVLPCLRVIRRNGTPGCHAGGAAAKDTLLLEAMGV